MMECKKVRFKWWYFSKV